MAFLKVKNRAASTLASGISDSDLSLTVATGEGALFPSTYPFHITIEDEILECTNRSTDVLTVTREAEGTTAAAHASGKAVELRVTAAIITELQEFANRIVWKDTAQLALSLDAQTSAIDWTDLDLTAYTSADAKFAMIVCRIYGGDYGTSGNNTLRIRKNGTAETNIYLSLPYNQTVWITALAAFFMGLDAGEVMEYKLELAAGTPSIYIRILVIGYIE